MERDRIGRPTDEDIEEMGAEDAGEFMLRLQDMSPVQFHNFIKARRQVWYKEPRQRVWRCVEHLCSYLVRIVEGNSAAKGAGASDEVDSRVSQNEAQNFFKARRKGVHLRSTIPSDTTDILAALARVRERVLQSLRNVKLFSGLTPEQIEQLGDEMTEAPFEEGELIFEQDEVPMMTLTPHSTRGTAERFVTGTILDLILWTGGRCVLCDRRRRSSGLATGRWRSI